MQLRGLLTAAIALLLVGGGLWYSNKLEKDKEGKPAPDAPPKIVEIATDQIQRIDIVKGAESTTVARAADGKWELTAPKAARADQDTVGSLAGTFNSLSSDRLIEEKPSNLAEFGLASPSMTVTVTKKDGKATKLLVGDETPASGGVFVKLDGDPRVFTIASYNKSSFDKTFKDLMDRRLVTFDSDKLSRLELTVKGQTIEFGKNNQNEWQIVKPKPLRADGGNVEELVRKIKDAKMDTAVSDADAAKASKEFGGAALVAVAKVTDAAGTQQIEVRKAKDNTYYARGSALEGVHKVTSDLGDGLNKSLDDLRQKKVFDFGWSDPSRIDVKDGAALRTFTKDKDKWKEGNKEMDFTSVQALIDKLRDLSASKFLDTGAGTPLFEVTVVSNEGKRTEKVLISKGAGENYNAVRDGEPSVYELTKTAFDELKTAASGVKEPAPPAAKKEEKKK